MSKVVKYHKAYFKIISTPTFLPKGFINVEKQQGTG
jgi:hypothetical protein